jgi:hypothetical protein
MEGVTIEGITIEGVTIYPHNKFLLPKCNDSLVMVTKSKFKENLGYFQFAVFQTSKILHKKLHLSGRSFSMFEKGLLNKIIDSKRAQLIAG